MKDNPIDHKNYHYLETDEETEKRIEDVFLILINNAVSTIDDISEELYLSKSMVHNILNEIKNFVEKYSVEIKSKPNVGLVVKGSEFKIRKILVERFANHYKDMVLEDYFSAFLVDIKNQSKLDSDTY